MNKITVFIVICMFLLAMLGSISLGQLAIAAGGVHNAIPSNTGDANCQSWADACTLQTALATAVSGDQVWVAAGTHEPHASDRTVSFVLKTGVAVYGGFAGTESLLSERDPTANPTILSSDIGSPDDSADNSYHVVIGSGTDNASVLDSFTIKDGNANGTTPNDSGGGMYIETGSPVLIYVTFSNNSAVNFGGEIYNEGNLTINNVIVANSTGGGCSNKPFNGGTLHADSDNNLIEHIGINACGLANGADGSRLLTRAITPLVPPQISARHPAAGSKLRFRGL